MFYEVNTERIESQLRCLTESIQVMEEVKPSLEEGLTPFFAGSRAAHLAVECVIDIGSVMIDGFIMRDPGGYHDIIDILEDEQVIPREGAKELKSWLQIRERLVRYYDEVSVAEVKEKLKDIRIFRSYITWVRHYLEKELGSVHTHGNEGSL
ncbi:DUF86 domain-containing protein [Kroppenstedtia pulmonis]|uniref:DUF86 domain-containing protein n=2 Tax=Kroppenstedtia pulmonis TaxID=1380685 RepID=A0A7D4B1L2_9BACL|nr:DUF86 domain-containing protein [Kroppenstedtia pulmonis]QKG83726.1 DUF86 domain-containing protein [Kroppenstedtia pulmonis]